MEKDIIGYQKTNGQTLVLLHRALIQTLEGVAQLEKQHAQLQHRFDELEQNQRDIVQFIKSYLLSNDNDTKD